MFRRFFLVGVLSVLAFALAPRTFPTASGQKEPAQPLKRGGPLPVNIPGKIELSEQQIPQIPGSLQVLRLTPQKPPTRFLQEMLPKIAPEVKPLAPLVEHPLFRQKAAEVPRETLGAFLGDRLTSYVDAKTGHAEIFPLLERMKAVPEAQLGTSLERAASLARQVFSREDIVQKDASQVVFEPPRPLLGEMVEQPKPGAPAQPSSRGVYLSYVPVRRMVGGYPVYGLGSRGLVVAGTDGTLQGFVRRWHTAARSGEVRETRSRTAVAQAIRAQLTPLARSAEVQVLGVEVAYYDGDRQFLQPVYRFTARIHELTPNIRAAQAHHVDDDFVQGYVPIGKELEPLPSLTARPTLGPTAPARAAAMARPGLHDPTVGRYVVRNDNSNWVADANEFWSGITSWFGGAFFTNSQYYWAEPFEFNTSEAAFVNSVNVALNEVHGDWWYFTTLQNCCEGVDITAIPASEGYGAANGGHLDYWILHSCEVVPSAADAPCPTDSRAWWTPWFNIFQGLHSVVGYRTIMWIDDDVGGPYGFALRFGAPVVSAWFNATASAPGYFGNPTYSAHCGRTPPMGRPSTVSSCGRQGDSVYDTTALPRANCLINFWQPN